MREDVASLRRICAPTGRWLFFVPLRIADGVRWNGCTVPRDCHIVCPPSSESLVSHGGGIEFAIVSVAALDAVDLVDAIHGKLATASRGCVIRPPVKEARALASLLIDVQTTLRFLSDTLPDDCIKRIAARIHSVLERCLRGAAIGERRERVRSPSSIVRCTEEFFREHLGERVSISEFSTVAGVSERSLRNAFHQVYMTSPRKHLRFLALHQVRRMLRAAPDAHAAVTTAATRHGFYELGRFAAQYRALFGEAPSETLHRARLEQVVATPRP
jgi:AraC-like DNA-binding protein